MKTEIGLHGGIALRSFTEGGTKYVRGANLLPEMTSEWPLKNRLALHNSSAIQFYNPPPVEVGEEKPKTKAELKAEAKAAKIAEEAAAALALEQEEAKKLLEAAEEAAKNVDSSQGDQTLDTEGGEDSLATSNKTDAEGEGDEV